MRRANLQKELLGSGSLELINRIGAENRERQPVYQAVPDTFYQ